MVWRDDAKVMSLSWNWPKGHQPQISWFNSKLYGTLSEYSTVEAKPLAEVNNKLALRPTHEPIMVAYVTHAANLIEWKEINYI